MKNPFKKMGLQHFGANVYLLAVDQVGYKTESAATVITQQIDPVSGSRIAIRAFSLACGGTATDVYFMLAMGVGTISTAVVSGATVGLIIGAEPQSTGNPLSSNDYVLIELDDGSYQLTTVATGAYTGFSISDALQDTVAVGNKVWAFGIYSDTAPIRHVRVYLSSTSASTTREEDGGVIFGSARGYPMMVYHLNDAAAAGAIDYVTVDYINK